MIPLHDDNPTTITPVVAIALIALCILVFLWQASLAVEAFELAVYRFGFIPATVIGDARLPPHVAAIPPILTVFTSMFLHGGFMHLAGNMLYLWIFGNNVEDAMGHTRFIAFYVLCGVAAAAAQALPNPDSAIPMIGASGAISGVLGAYLLLYPRARVLVLVPLGFYTRLLRLPALFVLGLWFVLQLISSALADSSKGGVAWGAHIGGFVAGLVLVTIFKRRGIRLFAPARPRRWNDG